MSSTEEKKEQAKDGIETPHRNDVLSGRGNFVNNHSGNEYFRSLVRMHKVAYVGTPKSQKPKYSRLIVDTIKGLDPPGRFLKQDDKTKLWHEIDDKKALDKTRQALREGAPDIAKVLDGDNDAPAPPQDGNSNGAGQERNKTAAPQPSSGRCSDSHLAPIIRQQPAVESGAPTYTMGSNPSVVAPSIPTNFSQDPHHHIVSPQSSLTNAEYAVPCQSHNGSINAQNYSADTSNSFQSNYARHVSSNSFQHQSYRSEVSDSSQSHSYHGEPSNLAQQTYAGELSNSVQQTYAEHATNPVQRNYSGGSSGTGQQNFSPTDPSVTTSQNFIGETTASFRHSFDGETATSVRLNYLRDGTTSVGQSYQGEAFTSVRHSFPGDVSNSAPANYLDHASISLQQDYRGVAPKSTPQQPIPQRPQQQMQEPPPQQKQTQQQDAAQPDEPQPSQDTHQDFNRADVSNGERRSSRRNFNRTQSLSLDDIGLMRSSVTGSTLNMSMDESGLSAMFQDSLKFSSSTDFHEVEGVEHGPRRSMMESDSGMSFTSLIDFDDAYNPSFRVIDEKD